MNYEEFLVPKNENEEQTADLTSTDQTLSNADIQEEEVSAEEVSVDLDIQKAVVESLAADKAEQDELISTLRKEKNSLQKEIESLQAEIAELRKKIEEQNAALAKVGDVLAKNAETADSNKIALLDRDIELPDRFPGETRDQVLDAIKVAREQAEKDGRIRRAQILEGVLLVNEPSGNLEKKRATLEKFFNDNQNILSGPVIAELEKYGISYKKGEDYLLPSEILKRTY